MFNDIKQLYKYSNITLSLELNPGMWKVRGFQDNDDLTFHSFMELGPFKLEIYLDWGADEDEDDSLAY